MLEQPIQEKRPDPKVCFIAANPDKVAEFRGGKEKIIGWFVGQVMQATKGKANPRMVNQFLRDKLKA